MKWNYYNPNAVEPPEDDEEYECPVCGETLSGGHELFINDNGDCVGCEFCISRKEAAEYFEE